MVGQKPEEASSFLKDKLLFIFTYCFLTYSCESSFDNFDSSLANNQIELQSFSQKSSLRKKDIIEYSKSDNRLTKLLEHFKR